MSVGVIIPTYNRLPNVSLALEALARQTDADFAVVVADDGSTDGTREAVESAAREPPWSGRLRWVGCGINRGFRPARTRNIAAGNLPAGCELMIMLDSDSLLEEHGVERYKAVHARHPRAVIMGMTEWLPPLPADEVRRVMREEGLGGLRGRVPRRRPERLQGTFVGPELRHELVPDLFTEDVEGLRPLKSEWALPLNSAYPLALFRELGGFDEAMVGYGYEDMELGMRASRLGAQCLPYAPIWALHVWHPKDAPEQRLLENQINLDYLLRKHGPDDVLEAEADWSLGLHYHRERGGRVVCAGGTLWALNRTATRRLRLTDLEWVERLGFSSFREIERRRPEELEGAAYAGDA